MPPEIGEGEFLKAEKFFAPPFSESFVFSEDESIFFASSMFEEEVDSERESYFSGTRYSNALEFPSKTEEITE